MGFDKYLYYAIKKAVKRTYYYPEKNRVYEERQRQIRLLKVQLGLKRGCSHCERIIGIKATCCKWCGCTFTEDETIADYENMMGLRNRLANNDPELLKYKKVLESYGWSVISETYARRRPKGFLEGFLDGFLGR